MIDLMEKEKELERKVDLLEKKTRALELAKTRRENARKICLKYHDAVCNLAMQSTFLGAQVEEMRVELDQENAACNDHYAQP